MKYVLSPEIDLLDLQSSGLNSNEKSDSDVGLQLGLRLRKSREQPKSIDIETARLLSEFSTPTEVSAAIVRYARKNSQVPEETVDHAFGAIRNLVNGGFLVDVEEIEWSVKASKLLRAGATFGKYSIVRVIQDLKNEFVLLCRGKSGFVVVKGARKASGKRRLKIERSVLEYLKGSVSPEVAEYNQSDEVAFIATDFIPGVTVNEFIRKHIPSLPVAQRERQKFDTAQRVLDAYSSLHSLGVMHGDIQPKNMLIRSDGSVKLVDFGASYCASVKGTHSVHHAGVTQFFNPKLARARLSGDKLKGEILATDETYSLGVVLFFLLFGNSYIDFSVDQDEMLEQISSGDLDTERWSALGLDTDRIAFFQKTFSTEDSARFATIDEMRLAFSELSAPKRQPRKTSETPVGLLRFRENVVCKALLEENMFREVGVGRYSNLNVNSGSAGIAAGLLRIAQQEQSSDILSAARVWSSQAEPFVQRTGYDEKVKDRPEADLSGSIFHGPLGTHYVSCLIGMDSGDVSGAQKSLSDFVIQGHRSGEEYDVSFGKAGLLIACSRLIGEAKNHPDLYEIGFLEELGHSLYTELIRQLQTMLRNIKLGQEVYSGFAHGVSGVLYSVAAWAIETSIAPANTIYEAISLFESSSVPVEFGCAWPRTLNSSRMELLGSWCNGSGGFAMTFALVSRLLANDSPASLAVASAVHANSTRIQAAGDMCCGYTGRAYSQIKLYQVTGERKWLENAEQLASMSIEAFKGGCMEESSLFKGHLGLAVLIGDLDFPDGAIMPIVGV